MSILDFFIKKRTCAHTHALISTNEGYCPECGAYVKKYFYIVRCTCCDVKREVKVYFGEVLPKEKFCTNCGCGEFYVQKLDTISFIDIPYAIHTKEVVDVEKLNHAASQVWVDSENAPTPRLLVNNL